MLVDAAVLDLVPDPRLCLDDILQHDGLLNSALLALGIVHEPLAWLSTDTAIYIGIVYSYLPFMVLPLYASWRSSTRRCWRPRPISAARRWKASGWSRCRCRCRASCAGALLVLHSDRRRIRHSRSARRLATR